MSGGATVPEQNKHGFIFATKTTPVQNQVSSSFKSSLGLDPLIYLSFESCSTLNINLILMKRCSCMSPSPWWSLAWYEVVLDSLTDSHSVSQILKTNSCEGEMVISEVICSAGVCLSPNSVKARRQQVKPEWRGVMEFRKWCKANRRECGGH